jgi:hippurate hydrolase
MKLIFFITRTSLERIQKKPGLFSLHNINAYKIETFYLFMFIKQLSSIIFASMKTSGIIFTVFIFSFLPSFAQFDYQVEAIIEKQLPISLQLCKHLHQNPELSFQEFETSSRMEMILKDAGFEVSRKFGGNNVVGIMRNGEGPVLLIRTDMDALPVEEKTGLTFASVKKVKDISGNEVPAMHACGHDIHMSVWAGTIGSMSALRDEWKGTLIAIAQQAEEVSGGAGLAIESGLFSKLPLPDYGLAYHINPELESGTIGLVEGPVFAGVKTAEIRVFGKGGHGAYPEKCIDPIVIASRIILDLQTIVSREISPLEPVVITVGSIHGGTRPNIIPDEVKMELTLRYYSEETIEKVIKAIRRISSSAAQAAGMPADKLPEVIVEQTDTPPVLNDAGLVEKIRLSATNAIGAENIIKTSPAMVGEDFGKYGSTPEDVPITLIWLGSTSKEMMKSLELEKETPPPLHSPYLLPDYEKTIETGIRVMVSALLDIF